MVTIEELLRKMRTIPKVVSAIICCKLQYLDQIRGKQGRNDLQRKIEEKSTTGRRIIFGHVNFRAWFGNLHIIVPYSKQTLRSQNDSQRWSGSNIGGRRRCGGQSAKITANFLKTFEEAVKYLFEVSIKYVLGEKRLKLM